MLDQRPGRGYNSREAIVQERRLFSANSTFFVIKVFTAQTQTLPREKSFKSTKKLAATIDTSTDNYSLKVL